MTTLLKFFDTLLAQTRAMPDMVLTEGDIRISRQIFESVRVQEGADVRVAEAS